MRGMKLRTESKETQPVERDQSSYIKSFFRKCTPWPYVYITSESAAQKNSALAGGRAFGQITLQFLDRQLHWALSFYFTFQLGSRVPQ